MSQQSKNQPAQTPTPDPYVELASVDQLAPEPSVTDQLAALAAAGSFVEQRIGRGQHSSGERAASDEIMAEISQLLDTRK